MLPAFLQDYEDLRQRSLVTHSCEEEFELYLLGVRYNRTALADECLRHMQSLLNLNNNYLFDLQNPHKAYVLRRALGEVEHQQLSDLKGICLAILSQQIPHDFSMIGRMVKFPIILPIMPLAILLILFFSLKGADQVGLEAGGKGGKTLL